MTDEMNVTSKPEVDREAVRKAHQPAVRHSKPKKAATKRAKKGDGRSAKEQYAQRKKEGLCVDCGTRKAKKDRVQCQVCIDATAARAAKRARKAK